MKPKRQPHDTNYILSSRKMTFSIALFGVRKTFEGFSSVCVVKRWA